MRTHLCRAALILWVLAAGSGTWMMLKGWTTAGEDGRTEIVLAPGERNQVLAEMRELLKAVHAIVSGAADQNLKEAEGAARSAGMTAAADAGPAIMLKLPLAFKQMGMSVHRDFDGLADGIARGETSVQTLGRLSSITSRCTTCHDLYRLSSK